MELLIIRHGEPDLSGDDLSDPPLTDLGQRQAVATAHHLSTTALDAVYISPQRRAQQTSVPLLDGRNIDAVTDERSTRSRRITHRSPVSPRPARASAAWRPSTNTTGYAAFNGFSSQTSLS